VAVKILRNTSGDNTEALLRFEREARVVARLRHPNIVQVHDFDAINGDPYLVMEYVGGPSLSQYLKALHQNKDRLPLPHVIRLITGVASALQYAHNNGVIHRDIKPGNILLTSPSAPILAGRPLPDDFEPVLTDFGLVRFLDSSRETTTGRITGTPAYMSPEQARGEATDERTDVYSLGIVLYEILAGHIPFDGESTLSILLKQVNEAPPPIPGLSPILENVLNRALAKDTRDRFQTPVEFAEAFREAVQTSSEHATLERPAVQELPPSPPDLQTPRARSNAIRIGVLAVIAIALGGILFAKFLPVSPPATATQSIPPPSATDTIIPDTQTSTPSPVLPLGPAGFMRFQNLGAIADQAILTMRAMPAPLAGNQYEVWLIGAGNRLSLGVFLPDQNGSAELRFADPGKSDLIARYDSVEITIEPKPDPDPKTSGLVAYSFTFPAAELLHIRYLLASFPKTPGKTALMQGLFSEAERIDILASEMQTAYQSGDRAGALRKGETMMNILVGPKSADYKDWNGDGKIEAGNGYGLLLNGSNFGYIQAVSAEIDYMLITPDATDHMLENGAIVKACVQDLAQWAPSLHNRLLTILTSPSEPAVAAAIDDSLTLADEMLRGVDLNNNGEVEPITGECGAQFAYDHAYYMADMPLLPVSISYQLTVVANSTSVAPTKIRENLQNTSPPPVNTAKAKPTKKPNPTPKSTKAPKKP
jgi:serine/threonine protein kinase